MSFPTLSISGHQTGKRNFDALELASKRIVEATLLRVGERMKKEMIDRAPRDQGWLHQNMHNTADDAGLTRYVGNPLPWAWYTEYGTGPHRTDDRSNEFLNNMEAWCERHGIDNPWPIIQKIRREGTQARPWLIPTFEARKGDLVPDLRRNLHTLELLAFR